MSISQQLIEAEMLAEQLLAEAQVRGYFVAHQTEKQLNQKLYNLAHELFGIKKYWHKRIVRSGANTLLPYKHNPPNLTIQPNDIFFIDFGPVFENWEADIGQTYVIGNDAHKLKLQQDVVSAWHEGRNYYLQHQQHITCGDMYQYSQALATKYGWKYTNEHCGHLIGNFPHENITTEIAINYLMANNTTLMSDLDEQGNTRHWIYEIHFVDEHLQIGGFYERYLI